MATGGSVESVTIDGRKFAVPADSDFARKLGGFENDVEANGDGSAREVKTRVPWSLSGGAVSIDDTRDDHEFLQNIADSNAFVTVTIAYVSGISYTGEGKMTEALEHKSMNTVMDISFKGRGKLTQV